MNFKFVLIVLVGLSIIGCEDISTEEHKSIISNPTTMTFPYSQQFYFYDHSVGDLLSLENDTLWLVVEVDKMGKDYNKRFHGAEQITLNNTGSPRSSVSEYFMNVRESIYYVEPVIGIKLFKKLPVQFNRVGTYYGIDLFNEDFPWVDVGYNYAATQYAVYGNQYVKIYTNTDSLDIEYTGTKTNYYMYTVNHVNGYYLSRKMYP